MNLVLQRLHRGVLARLVGQRAGHKMRPLSAGQKIAGKIAGHKIAGQAEIHLRLHQVRKQ